MDRNRQPLLIALAALFLGGAAFLFFASDSPPAPSPAAAPSSTTNSPLSASPAAAPEPSLAFTAPSSLPAGIAHATGDPARTEIDLRLERDRLQQLKLLLEQRLAAQRFDRTLIDYEEAQLTSEALALRASAAKKGQFSPEEEAQQRVQALRAEETRRTRLQRQVDHQKAETELKSEARKLDDQIAEIDRHLERDTPIDPSHVRDWRRPPTSLPRATAP